MNGEKIGGFLGTLRRSRGLTQREAAERLGVSNKTVSKWESGGGLPDITLLPALAALYGVTVDEILAGERADLSPAAEPPACREELHFRLGTALALVPALWSLGHGAPFWLLATASLLAAWVSWSGLGEDRLAARLWVLLWLGGILLYGLAGRLPWSLLLNRLEQPDQWFLPLARQRLQWSAWLLLLAVLYGLLAGWLRRKQGEPLLSKRCFWTALAGWGLSAAVDVTRWALDGPRWAAYLAVNRVHRELRREELLYGTRAWDVPVKWVALAAVIALGLVWLWESVREKDRRK